MPSDWDECNENNWNKFDLSTVLGQKQAGRFCGKFGKRRDLKEKQAQAFQVRVGFFMAGNKEFAEELQRAWDEGFSAGYSYFRTILEN